MFRPKFSLLFKANHIKYSYFIKPFRYQLIINLVFDEELLFNLIRKNSSFISFCKKKFFVFNFYKSETTYLWLIA